MSDRATTYPVQQTCSVMADGGLVDDTFIYYNNKCINYYDII